MIYLDNAATSWPKPESVYKATDLALRRAANPGRGGHKLSRETAAAVLDAREVVANFFGVEDSRNIIFTSGATESLNMVIYGLMPRVRLIVSTGFEHRFVAASKMLPTGLAAGLSLLTLKGQDSTGKNTATLCHWGRTWSLSVMPQMLLARFIPGDDKDGEGNRRPGLC